MGEKKGEEKKISNIFFAISSLPKKEIKKEFFFATCLILISEVTYALLYRE